MFGIPRAGQIDYTQVVELHLGDIRPSLAGPKRPQDRILLPQLRVRFEELFGTEGPKGFGKTMGELRRRYRPGNYRRSSWATATWSSPPSPPAPTPATRASCSRPGW
jgi:hypothetical protein